MVLTREKIHRFLILISTVEKIQLKHEGYTGARASWLQLGVVGALNHTPSPGVSTAVIS